MCLTAYKDNNKGCTNYTIPAILSVFLMKTARKGIKGMKGEQGRRILSFTKKHYLCENDYRYVQSSNYPT